MSVQSYIKEVPVSSRPTIDAQELVRQQNQAVNAYNAQKAAGLGNADTHVKSIIKSLSEQTNTVTFPTIAWDMGFKYVRVNGVRKFTRERRGTLYAQPKFWPIAPRVALAELSKSVEAIQISSYFIPIEHRAPIPAIPMAATELATRVKAKEPNAEFYLLFEPNWKSERKPFDPALLTRVPGMPEDHYYLIHIWGGDQDVIAPHISEAK